jgi:hypothetical protein
MTLISEELLSYLWQHKKFDTNHLYTEEGLPLQIVDTGQKNLTDGPDFMQVRVRIDGKLWAGSVEIDILQQNWALHGHHLNPNYNNVILHVIYEDEKNIPPIYRKDGTSVPVLNLKKYVSQKLTDMYKEMQAKYAFIPCEKLFMPEHIPVGFTSSLLVERLIHKSTHFYILYQQYLDWQEVFWIAFVQGLGYARNADAFMEIAQSIPYKIIQKYQQDTESIEALLFGTAGLLQQEYSQNDYYTTLKNKWLFLQQKHDLKSIVLHRIQWKGVRPANFPTIRLMVLAKIIQYYPDMITNGFSIRNTKEWYMFFERLSLSHHFWDNHYSFTQTSPTKIKKIGKNAINTLLINAILPIQFLYYHHHNPDKTEEVLQIYEEIPAENNNIIQKWKKLGVSFKSAYDTQAWIQVYKKYCIAQKCLSCKIGNSILTTK